MKTQSNRTHATFLIKKYFYFDIKIEKLIFIQIDSIDIHI